VAKAFWISSAAVRAAGKITIARYARTNSCRADASSGASWYGVFHQPDSLRGTAGLCQKTAPAHFDRHVVGCDTSAARSACSAMAGSPFARYARARVLSSGRTGLITQHSPQIDDSVRRIVALESDVGPDDQGASVSGRFRIGLLIEISAAALAPEAR